VIFLKLKYIKVPSPQSRRHHVHNVTPIQFLLSKTFTLRRSGKPPHTKADRPSFLLKDKILTSILSPNNIYINPPISPKDLSLFHALVVSNPFLTLMMDSPNQNQEQDPSPAYEASPPQSSSIIPNSKSASSKKRSLLQKISHSYTKNWKPLLFAKESWEDEYNFDAGGRQGVYRDMNGGGPRQR
jgi:hypothetical protein